MRGRSTYARGFTLIEMSIVLVIIGLIIGGVLVGQDLVRAAEIRGTITQVEKFNQAVNTFYGKYGALPGDLNPQVGDTSRNGNLRTLRPATAFLRSPGSAPMETN